MAAVGLQYTKNPIPALGFQSSGEDGSYEFVSVFYESARHLLESVIEVNVLEAMKVCAALCIFNTIGHATIAMAYADMGINFVLSLGPSLQYRPKSLDEDTWIKYKRVARTLVTLRSWLIATLGYVHKENVALQTGIQWLVDAQDLTPNETIQQELHKVVQIEANLLRTIDSAAQMQLHDYPQSTWRKELGHARSCLSVLEYCSKADKVAENFAEVTSGYYNVLAAQIQNTGDISVCDPPDNFEYLFSVPTLSHPQLQQISRDLLKRVSCPFDAPSSSLHDEATLRAGLGSHITLAFNNSPPKEQKSWSAVEMALSGMPTGQFVGSSQPHGWDVFLNLNTM
ncbi:hypothetical protein E8E12_008500 [Didymella heteroderae]|uniref:Uncharacterized protein n=1 Tax=Didymella heteroderae TaxID=1769908 RepID=A0A9P4WZF3_9PLEO|nr:hypothetical protein E8E12_008500 [Didymella heteroderae]